MRFLTDLDMEVPRNPGVQRQIRETLRLVFPTSNFEDKQGWGMCQLLQDRFRDGPPISGFSDGGENQCES